MAEGKKSRKFGNNKKYCEQYERMGKLERNKKRTARREQKKKDKKELKIELRIHKHKPVPSKHMARYSGTSNGTVLLLTDVTTENGVAAVIDKLGLSLNQYKVDDVLVENDKGELVKRYRIVFKKAKAK